MTPPDAGIALATEIAGKLTKAQREALLTGLWSYGAAGTELRMLGITCPCDGPMAPYTAELTPLGRRVRAILASQCAAGDVG